MLIAIFFILLIIGLVVVGIGAIAAMLGMATGWMAYKVIKSEMQPKAKIPISITLSAATILLGVIAIDTLPSGISLMSSTTSFFNSLGK